MVHPTKRKQSKIKPIPEVIESYLKYLEEAGISINDAKRWKESFVNMSWDIANFDLQARRESRSKVIALKQYIQMLEAKQLLLGG